MRKKTITDPEILAKIAELNALYDEYKQEARAIKMEYFIVSQNEEPIKELLCANSAGSIAHDKIMTHQKEKLPAIEKLQNEIKEMLK